MALVLDGTNGVSGVDGTASNPSLEGTDSNTGIFYPAADTVAIGTGGTERLRVDSAGNAGLGVTPSAWATYKAFSVGNSGNSVAGTGTEIHLTANCYYNAGWKYNTTERAARFSIGENYNDFKWYTAPSGTAGNAITFTQAMTLDASGNLGIGITADNPIANGGTYRNVLAGNGAGYAAFQGVSTATATGSTIAAFSGGTTGASGGKLAASINIELDGTSTTNATGRIVFYTCTGGNAIERARITSAGGFTCAGIYNTTVGATNRDVFVDNGGVVGYVSSLRASKTNIQDLTDTSWLHQLNPVTFNYRKKDEEGNYTEETDGDIQYGMIAEDVEQVRPDLCFYDEVDGEQELRGIQYSKLVPVMLKEIQKLRAELNALKGNA